VFLLFIDPMLSIDDTTVYCKIQPFEGCMNKTFYEVGKLYETPFEPQIQAKGYHCCANFLQCHLFVKVQRNCKFLRVYLDVNKINSQNQLFCSNRMFIIEELSFEEAMGSITKEMCLEEAQRNGYILKHIPKSIINYEICLAAAKKTPLSLEYVPGEFKSHEVCRSAVWRNSCALDYVPEDIKKNILNMEFREIPFWVNGQKKMCLWFI
jgi:hypothetical protein